MFSNLIWLLDYLKVISLSSIGTTSAQDNLGVVLQGVTDTGNLFVRFSADISME